MGRKVQPSVQPKGSNWKSFLYCMETRSNTLKASSVRLQPVCSYSNDKACIWGFIYQRTNMIVEDSYRQKHSTAKQVRTKTYEESVKVITCLYIANTGYKHMIIAPYNEYH